MLPSAKLTLPRHQASGENNFASRLGEVAVCIYILSHCYQIPLALIGPSWAVWPTACDFAFVLLAVAAVALWFAPHRKTTRSANQIGCALCCLGVVFVASYLSSTMNVFHLSTDTWSNTKGTRVGLYQCYRLAQWAVAFYVAITIPGTNSVRRLIARCVGVTLTFTGLGVVGTYFKLISTASLGPQLPVNSYISGPWAPYSAGLLDKAVGAVGYNHGYAPVQIVLLAAAYLSVYPNPKAVRITVISFLTVGLCFLTGGRAGFVTSVIFGVLMCRRNPRVLAVGLAVMFCAAALIVAVVDSASMLQPALDRQSTVGSSYEDDGIAGRTDIWRDRISLLNSQPHYWFVGTGFGSAVDTGLNAHLWALHVILECGLVGLLVFSAVFWYIIRSLWHDESPPRPLMCASVAFLVSTVSQDLFYPVNAFGDFMGQYLFFVGICVSKVELSRRPLFPRITRLRRSSFVSLRPISAGLTSDHVAQIGSS